MTEWQPIETAPRDGTIIILGKYGSVSRAAYYGRSLKAFNACAEIRFPWVFLDSTNGVNAMAADETGPTHWQPLPSPPETKL